MNVPYIIIVFKNNKTRKIEYDTSNKWIHELISILFICRLKLENIRVYFNANEGNIMCPD
jgi:hypothetical protein